jgi:hypothetical protein
MIDQRLDKLGIIGLKALFSHTLPLHQLLLEVCDMNKIYSTFLFVIAMISTGCTSKLSTPMPIGIITPTLTFQTPTTTLVPSPVAIGTNTSLPPLPTMEPKEAEQTIAKLMKENNNCARPCFWGLMPGITSPNEAARFLDTLGPGDLVEDGVNSYDDRYFRNKYNIEILLSSSDDALESIYAKAYRLSEIKNEDWFAFRPDTILRLYGPPTYVDFFLVETSFGKIVVFVLSYDYSDGYKLIIQYGGAGMIKDSPRKFHMCPLNDQQIDRFDIWIGENLENVPKHDEATSSKLMSLSPEEFYYRMIGNANDACVDLNLELSP